MNSQNFENISYCAGEKHRSGTKNNTGEVTVNKKTGREIKLLVGKYVVLIEKNL